MIEAQPVGAAENRQVVNFKMVKGVARLMSALKDLSNQIETLELHAHVQQEVDRLLDKKKCGIVFEYRLPSSLQLPVMLLIVSKSFINIFTCFCHI